MRRPERTQRLVGVRRDERRCLILPRDRTLDHEADAVAAEVVEQALVAHAEHADLTHLRVREGLDLQHLLPVDGLAEEIAGEHREQFLLDAALLRVIISDDVVEVTVQICVIRAVVDCIAQRY